MGMGASKFCPSEEKGFELRYTRYLFVIFLSNNVFSDKILFLIFTCSPQVGGK
jgi:hypothetical protein